MQAHSVFSVNKQGCCSTETLIKMETLLTFPAEALRQRETIASGNFQTRTNDFPQSKLKKRNFLYLPITAAAEACFFLLNNIKKDNYIWSVQMADSRHIILPYNKLLMCLKTMWIFFSHQKKWHSLSHSLSLIDVYIHISLGKTGAVHLT